MRAEEMGRDQPEEKMDKTMQHGEKLGDDGEWWLMGFPNSRVAELFKSWNI